MMPAWFSTMPATGKEKIFRDRDTPPWQLPRRAEKKRKGRDE